MINDASWKLYKTEYTCTNMQYTYVAIFVLWTARALHAYAYQQNYMYDYRASCYSIIIAANLCSLIIIVKICTNVQHNNLYYIVR